MISGNLSHYTILDKIGAGGMGEVYRARDTRLQREVAVKVLPEVFAADPEWLARFAREAQVLASLNHPNIAAIHGLEEADGRRALVMELVAGETLAERLERGSLPLEEALSIARQIAEGLEEAHDRGIIHRDLKPSNVKITPNGTVKLLDFGLAKALDGDAGPLSGNPNQSPTMGIMSTRAGVILGTVAYMSPEQARGARADRRSDIWAFGVVLFEMLAGRQAFVGDTSSDVLASVLKTDVDLAALPETVPFEIRDLLRRCLTRDPKQRLQSIGDARIALTEYVARSVPSSPTIARPTPAPRASQWRNVVPWAHAAVTAVLALTAAVLLWQRPWQQSAPSEPLRLSLEVGAQSLFMGVGPAVELSPDGSRLVFVSGDDSNGALNLRQLGRLDSTQIVAGAGVGNAPYHPFFSPDGQWIGFVTASELRKVPASGGTAQTLCKVERSRGATWLPDDTIVIALSPESGLYRVPSAGGEPKPLTTLDTKKNEQTHRWPQALPGAEAILFTSHTKSTGDFAAASIEAVVLATGERKLLHRGGSQARYVSSGHLVYVAQGTLFAVPFDVDRLTVTGSPAPVVQDVAWTLAHGGAQFSVSNSGRLVYVKGENTVPQYPIVWVDRNGGTAPLWSERGSYANPRLSPDGKRLALTVLRDGNWDIWIYDLERGVPTRLTFDAAVETEQVWSPDGQSLVYSSDQHGADSLYRKRADGSGDVERLTPNTRSHWATSWSPDGRYVAYITSAKGFDLMVLPLEGDRKPQTFLSTPFSESSPDFSPDSRWLAYDSNESGRPEVYVRPFPSGPGKWQVSDGGGAYPKWSPDGRELFYRVDDGIMAAPVEAPGDTFRAGKPKRVFQAAFRGGLTGISLAGNTFTDYDVGPDGRFVMFPAGDAATRAEHPHVTLYTDWFDELRRTFAKTEQR